MSADLLKSRIYDSISAAKHSTNREWLLPLWSGQRHACVMTAGLDKVWGSADACLGLTGAKAHSDGPAASVKLQICVARACIHAASGAAAPQQQEQEQMLQHWD